jgi:ribosomal protein S21
MRSCIRFLVVSQSLEISQALKRQNQRQLTVRSRKQRTFTGKIDLKFDRKTSSVVESILRVSNVGQ